MSRNPDHQDHPVDDQSETIAYLGSPAAHGIKEPVEVIETHAALVFLAGEAAYKIKRAVRYDYLDFSTLSKRETSLRRELDLNAAAAPAIYGEIVAVTRGADGQLEWDGQGPTVEWALKMRRFPTENELSHVAERGELDSRLAERLGRAIARYHCSAPVRSGKDGSHLIADIIDELNREFRAMDDLLGREHIERFTSAARAALDDLAPLLDQRTRDGHVRRCHGDLHLRNIVLIGDEPVLYDALEFDETLGTCDVLYDLAFLLMDMHHRNIGSAANRALNAYVRNAETDDHLTGLAALPLFIAVRAAISAMVAVHTARASGDDGEDRARDARHYLADAIAALEPQRPVLVAIGGLSGTGKTTIARLLASQIGAVPGAVHLRSDLIRKAMAGADPLSRLPAEEYSADSSRRVYDEICQKAVRTLEAGHSVIADATFLDPFERVAIEEAAEKADVPFAGIWLTAPEPVLLERVAARRGDASDADVPVLKQQIARDVGDISWAIFDASTAADAAARDIRLAITETAGL